MNGKEPVSSFGSSKVRWCASLEQACSAGRLDSISRLVSSPSGIVTIPDLGALFREYIAQSDIARSLLPGVRVGIVWATFRSMYGEELAACGGRMSTAHADTIGVDEAVLILDMALIAKDLLVGEQKDGCSKIAWSLAARGIEHEAAGWGSPGDAEIRISSLSLFLELGETKKCLSHFGGPVPILEILETQASWDSCFPTKKEKRARRQFVKVLFGATPHSDERRASYWMHVVRAAEEGDQRMFSLLAEMPDFLDSRSGAGVGVIEAAVRGGNSQVLVDAISGPLLGGAVEKDIGHLLSVACEEGSPEALGMLVASFLPWKEFIGGLTLSLAKSRLLGEECADVLSECCREQMSIECDDKSKLSLNCAVYNACCSSRHFSASFGPFQHLSEPSTANIQDAISSDQCELAGVLGRCVTRKSEKLPPFLKSLEVGCVRCMDYFHGEMERVTVETVLGGEWGKPGMLLVRIARALKLGAHLLPRNLPKIDFLDGLCDESSTKLFQCALSRGSTPTSAQVRGICRFLNPGLRNSHALILSASLGQSDTVKTLLSDGRVNARACENAALRMASESGKAEVVQALLSAGADPDDFANYAVRWAAIEGRTSVVKVLLANKGTDPACRDGMGILPSCDMPLSAQNGRYVLKKLLKKPYRRIRDEDANVLLAAARNGHSNIVELLVVDRRVFRGMTEEEKLSVVVETKANCSLGAVVALITSKDISNYTLSLIGPLETLLSLGGHHHEGATEEGDKAVGATRVRAAAGSGEKGEGFGGGKGALEDAALVAEEDTALVAEEDAALVAEEDAALVGEDISKEDSNTEPGAVPEQEPSTLEDSTTVGVPGAVLEGESSTLEKDDLCAVLQDAEMDRSAQENRKAKGSDAIMVSQGSLVGMGKKELQEFTRENSEGFLLAATSDRRAQGAGAVTEQLNKLLMRDLKVLCRISGLKPGSRNKAGVLELLAGHLADKTLTSHQ